MSLRQASCLAAVSVLLAAGASAADMAEIQKRGSLRVLVVPVEREPEFFSTKPDLPPGFDHEVLQGFANLHRLVLAVVPVPEGWPAVIPSLAAGKGDVIAGHFTVTDGRQKLLAFTMEVMPTRNVVVTRKPHRVVDTIEQLRTEKVGTVRGSSMAEAIAAAGVPPQNVDFSMVRGALPDGLRDGRVTAVVVGVETAIVAQQRDEALQIGLFLGPAASLAYGVRKGDPDLLQALNEYIRNFRRTPSWNRLLVRYFGENAPEILKKARSGS